MSSAITVQIHKTTVENMQPNAATIGKEISLFDKHDLQGAV